MPDPLILGPRPSGLCSFHKSSLMQDTMKVSVNGAEIDIEKGSTVLQACEEVISDDPQTRRTKHTDTCPFKT